METTLEHNQKCPDLPPHPPKKIPYIGARLMAYSLTYKFQ